MEHTFDREAFLRHVLPIKASGNPDRRKVIHPLDQWPLANALSLGISYGALQTNTFDGIAGDSNHILGVTMMDFTGRLKKYASPEALLAIESNSAFSYKVPVVVADTPPESRYVHDFDLEARYDGLRLYPIGPYNNDLRLPMFSPTGDSKSQPTFYVTDYGHLKAMEEKRAR